jgi:hypothetical protein
MKNKTFYKPEILDLMLIREYAGEYSLSTILENLDFLVNMYEISNSEGDFIQKVTYGITDETSSLDSRTKKSLRIFFYAI